MPVMLLIIQQVSSAANFPFARVRGIKIMTLYKLLELERENRAFLATSSAHCRQDEEARKK
jgi:hypothetical protein